MICTKCGKDDGQPELPLPPEVTKVLRDNWRCQSCAIIDQKMEPDENP